jgi:hypothetical protein
VRRVIAPIAAAFLALTIVGPVAADPSKSPTVNSPNTHLYVINCGGELTYQYAYGVPGWDASWAPGGTPWLEMGYTLTTDDGRVFTDVSPRGLVRNEKLVGPCTIEGYGWDAGYSITNAYLLIPRE